MEFRSNAPTDSASPTARARNALDPLAVPTVGALTPEQRQHVYNAIIHLTAAQPVGAEEDLNFAGGFEVAVVHDQLALTAMAETPLSLDAAKAARKGRPPSATVSNAFKIFAPILQPILLDVLSRSGIAGYLVQRAPAMIKDGWRLALTVMPYRDRDPGLVGLHKDTEGDNLFMLLLFPNEQPIMGPEYLLRPPLPDSYLPTFRRGVPASFAEEVMAILSDGMDPTIYNTRIPAGGGYVAACDELIFHSTPFCHHRGAWTVNSLRMALQRAADRYLNVRDRKACTSYHKPGFDTAGPLQDREAAWERFMSGVENDTTLSASVKQVLGFYGRMGKHGQRDPWVDLFEAASWTTDDKLWAAIVREEPDTVDPYAAGGAIELDNTRRFVSPPVPRAQLTRTMSGDLAKGAAGDVHPPSASRDFLRLWLIARHPDNPTL